MTSPHADRRTVLAACGAALGGGCLSTARRRESRAPAASVTDGSDWPMSKYDAARTGHAPDRTGPKSDAGVRWQREIYGHLFGPPSPVLCDGTLYYSAADSFVVADADSGRVRHEVENGLYASAPAVLTGSAYVDETLAVADSAGVRGVNPTGGVDVFGHRYAWSDRWTYPDRDREALGIAIGSTAGSAPVVADDTLFYAGPLATVGDAVVALDPSSGAERWRVGLGGPPTSPAVRDGTVFVARWPGSLTARDARDGSRLWHARTDEQSVLGVAVVDGRVHLTDRASVYAFDAATGDRLWRRTFDGQLLSSPTVADGTVFVPAEAESDSEGGLYALDAASGATAWRVPNDRAETPPIVADGVLYVAAHYDLRAIDPADGTELWRFETAGAVSPPVVADGRVYVAGGHVLYALAEQEEAKT